MHDDVSQSVNPQRFSQILQHLLMHEQFVLVVQLAEKWLEDKSLPVDAALTEGRALFKLCLMDRAWARAREVLEADSENMTAMILLADIYLRRGWTGKARKVIALIRQKEPNRRRLNELESLADAPSVNIPSDFELILQTGSAAQRLDLAERSLGLGKLLLARKALFRTLTVDPRNHRARQLIWALEGDLKPPTPFLQLWEIAIKFIDDDDQGSESTVSMPQNYIDSVDKNEFPHLFRNSYSFELTEEMTSTEMTMEMGFANQSSDVTVVEEPGEFNDTQILDFVGEVDLETPLNPDEPDSEIDQDVIVMTSIEQPISPPQISLQQVQLIKPPDAEELEKTEIVPKNEAFTAPSETGIEELGQPPARTFFQRFVPVILGVFVFLAICVTVLIGIWKTSENSIFDENMDAILSASSVQLQKRKATLQHDIASNRSPVNLRKQYLGLVCATLWRDFTGRPKDLECAQNQLLQSDAIDNWIDLTTKATIAMGNDDYKTAEFFLHDVDESNELVSLLQWEIKKHLTPSINWDGDVSSPRQFLSIVRSKSDFEIPSAFSDNLWLQVLQLEWQWQSLTKEEKQRRTASLLAKKIDLESKLYARVLLLHSQIVNFSSAIKLRQKAHKKDPQNAAVQYWIGWDHFRENNQEEALLYWKGCQKQNPECAYSQMLVYLYKDQLDTAQQFVDLLDGEVKQNLSTWILSALGKESSDLPTGVVGSYLRDKQIEPTTPLRNFVNNRVKTIKFLQNSPDNFVESIDIPVAFIIWLRDNNQLEKAHSLASAMVKEKLDCARCYRALIDVELLLGKKYRKSALENMERYLALQPNGPQVSRLREKLR